MSEQQDEPKYEIVEESYVDIVVRFRVGKTDVTPAEGIVEEQVARTIAAQMAPRKALIIVGRYGAPTNKAGFFEIETVQAWPMLWPSNKYEIHPEELSDDE